MLRSTWGWGGGPGWRVGVLRADPLVSTPCRDAFWREHPEFTFLTELEGEDLQLLMPLTEAAAGGSWRPNDLFKVLDLVPDWKTIIGASAG